MRLRITYRRELPEDGVTDRLLEPVGEERLSALWRVGVATGARRGAARRPPARPRPRAIDADDRRQVTPTRGSVSIVPEDERVAQNKPA